MAERQTDYTIAEGYTLPSKGLIYNVSVNPNVELRSMTARDEMKRLNPSTTPFKTLADIIEGCMLEKPAVNVYDMALGDYEFLLHKLRVVTYGDEYKIIVGCPHCGNNSVETVAHLDELKVKEFDEAEFAKYKTFTLPKSGHTVSIKFETPRMLDEIEAKTKEMKRKYKDASINFETLIMLSTIIESIDGEAADPIKIEGFINKLPAMDMLKIVNNSEKLNNCIGVDNSLYVTCPDCGEEILTFFRLGPEFFRPTTI